MNNAHLIYMEKINRIQFDVKMLIIVTPALQSELFNYLLSHTFEDATAAN